MKIFHTAEEVRPGPSGVCLAIGFFDGVHRGHQRIVQRAVESARSTASQALVLTFEPHPNQIVAPGRVPPLIYSLQERLRRLEECKPDGVLLLSFDRALSHQSGEQFVRALARQLQPIHSISVGQNFMFGYKRSGNVQLLQRLGRELGFAVEGMEYVTYSGAAISSTRIRAAIISGDLQAASEMLGRPYALCATVIRGRGLGRQLGFPTANLDATAMALPPAGVYAIRAFAGDRTYPGVLNVGHRPTVEPASKCVHVEAHLLGLSGDLYGTQLCVEFQRRLRPERKFAHVDELRAQIARDIEDATYG